MTGQFVNRPSHQGLNPRSLSGTAAVAVALLSMTCLSGCVNLSPALERPALPVPPQLPGTPAASGAGSMAAVTPVPAWQAVLQEPRLAQVVSLALQNNRDLRVALLNVDKSRAQLGLADADRWPTLSAALMASRAPNSKGEQVNTFQAGLQLSSFELDLLGRVRSASDAAAANLLATEAAGRAARLALITQTAGAWLTLAADQEQLALARQTLVTRDESLQLTVLRERVGAASQLDLRAAQTLSASARATVAQLERQQSQDRHALALLTGTEVPVALLPDAATRLDAAWLASVPTGLSSDVLLARPDVIQAEQQLAAANASIGAARAALFPRIVLSGSAGEVSDSLRNLFDAGHFASTVTASLAQVLFDGGRSRANVKAAEVGLQQAAAGYDKVVQSAFREASDALEGQSTWHAQLQAQQELAEAEGQRHQLTQLRLQRGAASLIDMLDAERSLVSARQAVVQVRLGELLNRLSLYKALGGQ